MPSVPAVPNRGYSFTDYQTFQPSTPLPGNRVDTELDRLFGFNAELIPWLRVSINDDGTIRANAADVSTIIASLSGVSGLTWRGNYSAPTSYVRLDVVFDQNSSWLCIADTPPSGVAPPTLPTTSNAKWALLARAGTNGVDGVSPGIATLVSKDAPTGAAFLPVGTTAQRPSSPSAGFLRYNTTLNTLEVYDGAVWQSVGGAQVFALDQTFTATAGQTVFNITGSYTPGTVQVFRNGLLLDMGIDVIATNGTSFTLIDPAAAGDLVQILGWGNFSVANAVAKSGDTMSGQLFIPNVIAVPDSNGNSNLILAGPSAVTRFTLARDGVTGRFLLNRHDASGVFQSSPIIVDPTNGFVGVNGQVPTRALDVNGDIASTTQVSAPALLTNAINSGPLAGFRNRILNPRFEIAQRGTSGTVPLASAYNLDRWTGITLGVAVNWAQQPGGVILGETAANVLQFGGVAGNTFLRFLQRIEAANSRDLCGKTVTFSIYVAQQSGAARNFNITCFRANAVDNWSASTALGSNTTSLLDNTWTRVSLTVALPASGPENGLSFDMDFGGGNGLVAGQLLSVWGAQLEIGDRVTPLEFRPRGLEQQLCRRYFRRQAYQVPATTAQNLGTIEMRATPAITGGGTGFNSTNTSADNLIAFQTTGGVQTLDLNAEI